MNLLSLWRCSIACLSYEIHHLYLHNNLLPDTASERHEFFFADLGIPRPRPCTILAWSSLCHINPVQVLSEGLIPSLRLDRGNFLIPFLPKIRYGEETNQSLVRTSRAHVKDSDGNIKWGNVFIGEVETGNLVEQLPHGAFDPKEWCSSSPRLNPGIQFPLPPLWAFNDEGWQFGIIQNIPSMNQTFRDPMIELARHGIPELSLFLTIPRIRRLLFRIHDTKVAQSWAVAYAESISSALSESTFLFDAQKLISEINEFEQQKFRESMKESKGPKGSSKRAKRFDDFELDFTTIDKDAFAKF